MIIYKQTSTGEKYIVGFNAFRTDYLNKLAADYNYRSNRVYGESLELPYDESMLKIGPNALINSETVNEKLHLLYKNYIYILSKSSIGKIDAFADYRGSSHFPPNIYDAPHQGAYKTEYVPQSTDSILDAGVRSVVMTGNNDPDYDSMVVALPNRLLLCKFRTLESQQSCHSISVISTSGSEMLVDSENDLEFKSIKKVVTNNKGALFTLDTGRSIIYRHNIRGLTRGDRILNAKETTGRMLDVMVGRAGDINSKIQFANPIDITYHRNRLYVLDGGSRNFRIKVYDDQINWLDTYNISLDYTKHSPISIAGNTDSIFILTEEGVVIQYSIDDLHEGRLAPIGEQRVNIIDTDYNLVEKYIEIKFSTINDNTCYIVTNRSVYKLMVDKLDRLVGQVDWVKHRITSMNVTPICMDFIERRDEIGLNVIVASDVILNDPNRTHETLLLHFTDNDNMLNMMSDGYETNLITYDNITIKPEEYVSPLVYNKAISKLLHNLNIIYNSIVYIVSNEITPTGSSKYPGIRYISEDELSTFRIHDALKQTKYIGVNELVSSATINRCLQDIVSKQNTVLHLIRDRNNTLDFYYGSVNRLKRLPVPVVESYLASGYRYRIQKIE
jgi:hypothetical protein